MDTNETPKGNDLNEDILKYDEFYLKGIWKNIFYL